MAYNQKSKKNLQPVKKGECRNPKGRAGIGKKKTDTQKQLKTFADVRTKCRAIFLLDPQRLQFKNKFGKVQATTLAEYNLLKLICMANNKNIAPTLKVKILLELNKYVLGDPDQTITHKIDDEKLEEELHLVSDELLDEVITKVKAEVEEMGK